MEHVDGWDGSEVVLLFGLWDDHFIRMCVVFKREFSVIMVQERQIWFCNVGYLSFRCVGVDKGRKSQ